jgi:hypothetical protein
MERRHVGSRHLKVLYFVYKFRSRRIMEGMSEEDGVVVLKVVPRRALARSLVADIGKRKLGTPNG